MASLADVAGILCTGDYGPERTRDCGIRVPWMGPGGRGQGAGSGPQEASPSPRALALGAAPGCQRHRGGHRAHAEPQLQPQCASAQQQPAPGGPAGAPSLDRSPVSATTTLALPKLHPHGHLEAREERCAQINPESQVGRQRSLGWPCCLGLVSGESPESPVSPPKAQGGLGPQPPPAPPQFS